MGGRSQQGHSSSPASGFFFGAMSGYVTGDCLAGGLFSSGTAPGRPEEMMMLGRSMLSCCFMYSSVDEESVDECDRY